MTATYCRYRVHVTFQYPAWDERDGFDYEVSARSKAQANKHARNRFADDGHTGRAFFRAELLTTTEG